jgi:hypothetical protein
MIPNVIPDGYTARWRGADYEASPDGAAVRLYSIRPEPGFETVGDGRYRRTVPAGEVDGLGYLRTVGLWRDVPVLVLAERDGRYLVEYHGGNGPAARALGLARIDVAVYAGWVDAAQVCAVRQEAVY